MRAFTERIVAAISKRTGIAPDDVVINTPRDAALGDFAFPCFLLAKQRKMAPPAVATELAAEFGTDLAGEMAGIEAIPTGPFLNFRVDRTLLAKTVIGEVQAAGDRWGGSEEGAGKTVVVDLSSPNIAKPMSVGHLRSTVIGAAIQRLHTALGYRTVGINHIGDWGSQFGKLVAAIDRWGDERDESGALKVDLEKEPIRSLLALYVRYHEEEESDPSLAEEAAAAFRELESGKDGHVRETWQRLTTLSLAEFDVIYKRLGVQFDVVRGEAFYEDHLDQTIDRIVAAGVTSESEGALVVDLTEFGENIPPSLLRKTDGTTLYATRDLAAAFHRWEEYAFHRCLYVVGSEQKLHFRQMKHVLERMGLEWEQRIEHIDFGLMRLPEGKMSTRKGRVVFLDEVLDAAVKEADRIIAEKNPDLDNRTEVAEQVGIGAVVFNDLRRERIKDVEFVLSDILSFEGETGPYVQYTHARLASIQRKAALAEEGDAPPDQAELADADQILLLIGRFPEVVQRAAAHAEPSEVASYLLTLCREVNTWYVHHRVLGQDPGVTSARLTLVAASKSVIANGLALLGLAAPEEM